MNNFWSSNDEGNSVRRRRNNVRRFWICFSTSCWTETRTSLIFALIETYQWTTLNILLRKTFDSTVSNAVRALTRSLITFSYSSWKREYVFCFTFEPKTDELVFFMLWSLLVWCFVRWFVANGIWICNVEWHWVHFESCLNNLYAPDLRHT